MYVELVLVVFLVDDFFFLLKFFIFFGEISPVEFELEAFVLFFVSFFGDEFFYVFRGSLFFVEGDVLLELDGFLL